MLTVNGWIMHLICISVPLLPVVPCLHFTYPLCFTLAYHTLHTYGLSLTVKVRALAACSPPGSVCLYWISWDAQDKMAYHLLLILCTWDAVTACTLFFPLGMQLCSEKNGFKATQSWFPASGPRAGQFSLTYLTYIFRWNKKTYLGTYKIRSRFHIWNTIGSWVNLNFLYGSANALIYCRIELLGACV